MQIKDLISKLQALYNTYDDEYKSVMGEPEITIDIFRRKNPGSGYNYDREYVGFSGKIVIAKSPDGIYDILSAFDEDQDQDKTKEAKELSSYPWPFPQSGEA